MNTNNKNNFNYILKYSIVDGFNFNNAFQIKTFEKLIIGMKINISLNEETAAIFPRTIWLLEHISTQKPFVKNLKTKRIGRNQRRIFFSTSVSLRSNKALSFIYFYNCFLIKMILKRMVFYNRKINKFDGDYSFTVKNINVFPGYLEDFFKWPYYINFNFILRNYDVNINKTILQNFGIWTI